MTNDRTNADIIAADLTRLADATARRLEALANRIRMTAVAFNNPRANSAIGVAADIVNEYTQGVGSGTFMWDMVKTAADLDRERASISREEGEHAIRKALAEHSCTVGDGDGELQVVGRVENVARVAYGALNRPVTD